MTRTATESIETEPESETADAEVEPSAKRARRVAETVASTCDGADIAGKIAAAYSADPAFY